MTYIYECDGWCDGIEKTEPPALTGEFSERFFKTSAAADELKREGYTPGDLVTLCGGCTARLLTKIP